MAEISDEEFLAAHPEHRELDPAIRAQLRQNAQLTADLENERASRAKLELKALLADAGIPNVPEREMFEATYTGEMTVDAIKEAAGKFPALTTAEQVIAPDAQASVAAINRSNQATAAAPPAGAIDFGDALDGVRSPEEWDRVMASAPADSGVALPRTAQGYRIV